MKENLQMWSESRSATVTRKSVLGPSKLYLHFTTLVTPVNELKLTITDQLTPKTYFGACPTSAGGSTYQAEKILDVLR